jgi:hypothetical protein
VEEIMSNDLENMLLVATAVVNTASLGTIVIREKSIDGDGGGGLKYADGEYGAQCVTRRFR